MLGIRTAKRTVEERITRPVSAAVVLSIFALILAAIAVVMGMSR